MTASRFRRVALAILTALALIASSVLIAGAATRSSDSEATAAGKAAKKRPKPKRIKLACARNNGTLRYITRERQCPARVGKLVKIDPGPADLCIKKHGTRRGTRAARGRGGRRLPAGTTRITDQLALCGRQNQPNEKPLRLPNTRKEWFCVERASKFMRWVHRKPRCRTKGRYPEFVAFVPKGGPFPEPSAPAAPAPQNKAPKSNDDTATTDEDSPEIISVLANDTDEDGDPLSIESVNTNGTRGEVTVNANNTVTYDPTDQFDDLKPGQTATDRFDYKAKDPSGANSGTAHVDVTVTGGNDAPKVTTSSGSAPFTENQAAAQVIDSGLSLTDADSASLDGATVAIASGFLPVDELEFVNQLGISGTYDSGTGILTLTGTAPVSDYQTALRSIEFKTTSEDPGTSRTIAFTATDDEGDASGVATRSVAVESVNDAPVNSSTSSAMTTPEDTPFTIPGILSVTDLDANPDDVRTTLSVANGALAVDSTTGTVTGQNTGSVQVEGTVAEVNAAIDSVQYTPPANFNGSDPLTMSTSDLGNSGSGGVLTDTDNVGISVVAVNDAPVNTVPATGTINEDAAFSPSVSIADVDAATGTVTTTLSAADGAINVQTGLPGVLSGNGSNSVIVTGTVAEVNGMLATVGYTPPADANGTRTLSVSTSDNGNTGAGAFQIDTDSVLLTINAVNDAPVLTNPGVQTINEDTSLAFTDATPTEISVADVDSGSDDIQVQVSVANGMLSDGGLPSSSLTLTGSLTTVNAALDGLTYTPNANYNGPDLVAISVSDLGRNGSGGAQTDTGAVPLIISAVNDAPVNGVPGAQTVVENGLLTFSAANTNALTVSDVDAGTATMAATLSVAHGTLTIPNTSGLSFHTGNGTASVTINGSQAAITTALNGLAYAPTAAYTGPDALNVTSNDLGNTGSGGALSDGPDVVPITVSALNKAPINSVPGTQTVNEDTNLTFSSGNANAISTSDVDAGANEVQITLGVDSGGSLTLGGTTGLTFMNGANGTDSMTFTGTLANVNAALNGLTFRGAANDTATRTLTVTTNDQGFTGVGGPQSDTDTVTINQTAVNDAPVNTVPGTQSVDEDQVLNLNGALSVADVDAGSGDLEVSLTSANSVIHVDDSGTATVSFNDSQSIHIVGTLAEINLALATVTYQANSNVNGARTLTLASEDNGNTGTGGALVDSDDVTINVNEVNDAPSLTVPASASTTEGQAFLFTGGSTPSVADVDAGTDPLEMTLSVQHGTLTLDGTTGLSFTAGDGTGDATMTFQGTQTAINDALSGMRYDPTPGYNNTAAPGPPAELSYSVSDLGNNGSGATGTDSDSTDITVQEANTPPVNTVPGAQTLNEDSSRTFSPANTNAILISDADAGPTNDLTVSLSVSTGTLTLNGTTGLTFSSGDGTSDGSMTFSGTQIEINGALDGLIYVPNANTNGTDTLTVTTNDNGHTGGGGAQSDTDNVTLNVTAVNDAPFNTVPGAQSVDEDTDLTFPGNVSVSDTEAGSGQIRTSLGVSNGTLTLATTASLTFISGANGTGSMTFEGTQAQINTALNGLKYRGNQHYFGSDTLVVTTNDKGLTGVPGALEDSDNVAITVNPVNDAPDADNESLANANRAIGNTSLRVTETGRDGGGLADPDGPQKDLSGSSGEVPPLHGDTDVDNTAAELSVKDTDGTNDGVINLTTNDGGQVVMDSDGDYVFFPDHVDSCTDHSDFFDYTVTDQGTPEGTDTGRVTIEVQDCVWYADAGAGSHGDGRSHSPFQTFADIDSFSGAGDTDGTNQKIFVYDGTYTGGMPLEDGQRLLSERHGLSVDNGDGDGDQADQELHAANAGAGDSIVNGGVVVGRDNTLQGIDMENSGAPGVYALSSNTLAQPSIDDEAGTLIVNTVTAGGIDNQDGGAVNISGGTNMNVQLDRLSSDNSTGHAVRVHNSTGTFNASGPGTLEDADLPIVRLDGGSTTFTLNAGITGTGSESLASIVNQTGGTKRFTGLVQHDGLGGNGGGVSLQSNSASTVTRFEAGLRITNSAANGLVATSGGTLAIPDPPSTNNLITTTTGTPLSVVSTTIHNDGLVFEKISSNGAPNGIVLNGTTNPSGSLTVTGAGFPTGTGGTIQASSGAGVSLTNVPSRTNLTRMGITGGGSDGISGATAGGLLLHHSNVSSNGNAPGEHGLDFTALTGTVDIDGTTVSGNRARGVSIVNDSGTLDLTMLSSTVSNHNHATDGEDGLNVKGTGTGTQNVQVQSSTFSNNRGDQIQVLTDDSNTVTQSVNVLASTLNPVAGSFNSGGIAVTAANSATVTADLNGNFVTGGANAVNLNYGNSPDAGTTGTGTMAATVRNNTLNSKGDGIRIVGNKGATMTARVDNNNVQGYTQYGIEVHRADGNGVTNATITRNTVHNPNNDPLTPALDGIHAQAGAGGTSDAGTSCFEIGGAGANANNVTGSHGVQSGSPVGFDIQVRNRANTRINLPGYTGGNADLAAVEAYLASRNIAGAGGLFDATKDATAQGYFNTSPAGSACPQP